MPLNDQLKSRVKRFTTAATAAAVTGNLASDADASLHIEDIGRTVSPGNSLWIGSIWGEPNYGMRFRGITWVSTGTTSSVFSSANGWQAQVSNADLSHLNEAKWNSGVMIGPDANNGVTSAGVDGRTAHAWEPGPAVLAEFNSFYLSSMVPGILTGTSMYGPWRPTPGNNFESLEFSTGYLGIRFENYDGDHYYGWVELTVRTWGEIYIERWAMEDEPNVAVMTGDPVDPETIPEPASIAIWAIGAGAVGLRALRRRRQHANDQVS